MLSLVLLWEQITSGWTRFRALEDDIDGIEPGKE